MLFDYVAYQNGVKLANLVVEGARHGHQRIKIEEFGHSLLRLVKY